MTDGLPLSTWLLLVLSVGPALILVFRFWSRSRSADRRNTAGRHRDDPATGDGR